MLYQELANLLTKAHERKQLTQAGEAFFEKFMAAKEELQTGVSELSDLGWEQHQRIARTMYNNFPEVFKKGGNVLAISSLSGRCVLSMSSFCQELVQCNPAIEIREQSSRFTLDGVVPSDRQNPKKRQFPKSKARWEQNRDKFKFDESLREKVVNRTFTSTDSLPGNMERIGSNLINLYTSLPSIGHEGMMEGLISDDEMVAQWEQSNLGSYSWVFEPQNDMVPILLDIIRKADAVIGGSSDRIADLRFGHDTCIGPLTVLMGIDGADGDQRCRQGSRGSLRGEEHLPELADVQGVEPAVGVLSRQEGLGRHPREGAAERLGGVAPREDGLLSVLQVVGLQTVLHE